MTGDVIKLDYQKAEDMIRTFRQGAEQLQQTMQEMQAIATTLEGGALLGEAGGGLVEALRGTLVPTIGKLHAKFEELSNDVGLAIRYMQEADRTSKSQFK